MGIALCSECDRLWTRYEEIIFAQVRAQNQLGIVNFGYDPGRRNGLAAEVEMLTRDRSELQAMIRKHNREAHSMDIACRVIQSPQNEQPEGLTGPIR